MTGGRVVVLGEVGQNFAAGMSGGVVYVYDELGTLAKNTNLDLVHIEVPTPDELMEIRLLISDHVKATSSPRGIKMLYRFESVGRHFKKVIPRDYERMMQLIAAEEAAGKSHDDAQRDAFAVLTA